MKHEIWTEILPQHARKVYLKHKHRGFCRLCGCDTESRYMINVLSIAAVQKFLVKIISESYGIVIKRSDGLPVTACTMQKMHSVC